VKGWTRADLARQFGGLLRFTAAFLRFSAKAELQENVDPASFHFSASREGLDECRAVHAFDGIEEPRCEGGLIPLKLADHPPFETNVCGFGMASQDGFDRRPHVSSLLDITLTQHTKSRVNCRKSPFEGLFLCDSD